MRAGNYEKNLLFEGDLKCSKNYFYDHSLMIPILDTSENLAN